MAPEESAHAQNKLITKNAKPGSSTPPPLQQVVEPTSNPAVNGGTGGDLTPAPASVSSPRSSSSSSSSDSSSSSSSSSSAGGGTSDVGNDKGLASSDKSGESDIGESLVSLLKQEQLELQEALERDMILMSSWGLLLYESEPHAEKSAAAAEAKGLIVPKTVAEQIAKICVLEAARKETMVTEWANRIQAVAAAESAQSKGEAEWWAKATKWAMRAGKEEDAKTYARKASRAADKAKKGRVEVGYDEKKQGFVNKAYEYATQANRDAGL